MSDTLDAPTTAKSAKTPRTRKRAGQLAQFLPYQLSIASNAVSDVIAERYREGEVDNIALTRMPLSEGGRCRESTVGLGGSS